MVTYPHWRLRNLFLWITVLVLLPAIHNTAQAQNPSQDFLQVVYDSESRHSPPASPGWGYAAYIQFGGRTFFFDTGLKEDKLKNNLNAFDRKPENLNYIIVSHIHPDHWGGVDFLWKKNPKVPVFIPTIELSNRWPGRKSAVVEDHKKLTENIWVVRSSISNFDPFGGKMHELTLVLKTKQGLVLVVGCSHPGLEKIINRVQSLFPEEIYLVTGGFHYIDFSEEEIEKKVKGIKKLGVKKVGPSHCRRRNFLQAL
jgi:7,8-dihydropterin-6-yl-methyl-4-(beta-D-ribofuranosyl)aminobenzene 5'-phosphate synthase